MGLSSIHFFALPDCIVGLPFRLEQERKRLPGKWDLQRIDPIETSPGTVVAHITRDGEPCFNVLEEGLLLSDTSERLPLCWNPPTEDVIGFLARKDIDSGNKYAKETFSGSVNHLYRQLLRISDHSPMKWGVVDLSPEEAGSDFNTKVITRDGKPYLKFSNDGKIFFFEDGAPLRPDRDIYCYEALKEYAFIERAIEYRDLMPFVGDRNKIANQLHYHDAFSLMTALNRLEQEQFIPGKWSLKMLPQEEVGEGFHELVITRDDKPYFKMRKLGGDMGVLVFAEDNVPLDNVNVWYLEKLEFIARFILETDKGASTHDAVKLIENMMQRAYTAKLAAEKGELVGGEQANQQNLLHQVAESLASRLKDAASKIEIALTDGTIKELAVDNPELTNWSTMILKPGEIKKGFADVGILRNGKPYFKITEKGELVFAEGNIKTGLHITASVDDVNAAIFVRNIQRLAAM